MLTAQHTSTLVQTFFDIYNRRDFDQGEKLVTDDVDIEAEALKISLSGPAGYREFVRMWVTAFPGGQIEVKNVVANEEFGIAEVRARGAHTGPLVTPATTLTPTKRKVDLKFCQILRFREEKISEMRLYFDSGSLMRQIGFGA